MPKSKNQKLGKLVVLNYLCLHTITEKDYLSSESQTSHQEWHSINENKGTQKKGNIKQKIARSKRDKAVAYPYKTTEGFNLIPIKELKEKLGSNSKNNMKDSNLSKVLMALEEEGIVEHFDVLIKNKNPKKPYSTKWSIKGGIKPFRLICKYLFDDSDFKEEFRNSGYFHYGVSYIPTVFQELFGYSIEEYLTSFQVKDSNYDKERLVALGRRYFKLMFMYCPSLLRVLIFKDSEELKRIIEVNNALGKFNNLKGSALVDFIVYCYSITDYVNGEVSSRYTQSIVNPEGNEFTYAEQMCMGYNLSFHKIKPEEVTKKQE